MKQKVQVVHDHSKSVDTIYGAPPNRRCIEFVSFLPCSKWSPTDWDRAHINFDSMSMSSKALFGLEVAVGFLL